MAQNDLYEVALMIDDLKNDDVKARLNSMRNLPVIAKALGASRARTELIPYLAESIDDEDEVLLEMSQQLGASFVDLIGGPEHAASLFQVLQLLASGEDPTVREAATTSMNAVSRLLSYDDAEKEFFGVVKDLFEKDWFTSRSSCCYLLPTAYDTVQSTEARKEMREMFADLASDSRVVIRRAASKNLATFCGTIEVKFVSGSFFETLMTLTSDPEDTVRSATVSSLVPFMGYASKDSERQMLEAAAEDLGKDKSWKIRWTMSDNFRDIFDAFQSNSVVRQSLVEIYLDLLSDNEAEVQRIATEKLPDVARRLEDEVVVNKLLPKILRLSQNFEVRVRETLATVITELAPIFHSQNKLEAFLKPYLDLIGDEEANVRLAVIQKLNIKIPGPDRNEDFVDRIIPTLLPSFYGLIDEARWRIRNSAIKLIPLMAEELGLEKFTESLADTVVENLSDEAAENRYEATENIRKLYEMFGIDWISKRIMPKLTRLSKNENYLLRIQSIRVVQTLASRKVDESLLSKSALPMLSELAGDQTPNVKFNVAKCLQALGDSLDDSVVSGEVKPILKLLKEDKDADVVYYATQALEMIGA